MLLLGVMPGLRRCVCRATTDGYCISAKPGHIQSFAERFPISACGHLSGRLPQWRRGQQPARDHDGAVHDRFGEVSSRKQEKNRSIDLRQNYSMFYVHSSTCM